MSAEQCSLVNQWLLGILHIADPLSAELPHNQVTLFLSFTIYSSLILLDA
jgi:hypothetical protein